MNMSQIKIWIALSLMAGLFLLIGVQGSIYAQMSNETSMMGNATGSMSGNMTNSTSDLNMTGNISGHRG
jgi:hypothetical protein